MGKTLKREKSIILNNRNVIYDINRTRYIHTRHYLENGALRNTLLAIYRYMNLHQSIKYQNQYCYLIDTDNLTSTIRRRGNDSKSQSNKHLNLLCALGMFKKIPQTKSMLNINKAFTETHQGKLPINCIALKELTHDRLEKIEQIAEILHTNKVTSGNISYAKLSIIDRQYADSIYPYNNRKVPDIKIEQYNELKYILDTIVDVQGYCTKQELKDNCNFWDNEIDKLFKIFNAEISKDYFYKRPTAAEVKKFNLINKKYIYVRKGENHETERN